VRHGIANASRVLGHGHSAQRCVSVSRACAEARYPSVSRPLIEEPGPVDLTPGSADARRDG